MKKLALLALLPMALITNAWAEDTSSMKQLQLQQAQMQVIKAYLTQRMDEINMALARVNVNIQALLAAEAKTKAAADKESKKDKSTDKKE